MGGCGKIDPGLDADGRRVLNTVCRERMKLKLLADIRMDLIVCELEGWDKTEYINELIELITTTIKQQ